MVSHSAAAIPAVSNSLTPAGWTAVEAFIASGAEGGAQADAETRRAAAIRAVAPAS